ncbi:MAG: proprotein convertase P-domain-containing protein [Planctomycetes bacterium]|nr:proprotein convertase P-domain-containing protein [Planctomycetota bacterium]
MVRCLSLSFALAGWVLGGGALAQSQEHQRMLEIARQIERARTSGAPQRELTALLESYQRHAEHLGGDDPANATFGTMGELAASPLTSAQSLITPTCGSSTTSAVFNGSAGPIPSTSSVQFTATVSGLGAYLWDVNVRTFLAHTACQDLDVTLISPAGTAVVLTTDNAGINDDCFNGTLWDDNVNDPVTDRVFTNLVVATPLSAEGRLAAFRGENPNGTWTLFVQDDNLSNTGSLGSWTIEVASLPSAPSQTTSTFARTPNLALADNATTNDVVAVSGLGSFTTAVKLYVELPHTFSADLDVRLISPAGTAVVVTTDGGGSFDNVFNGTTFDPDATAPVTDKLFADNVVAALLSPEGSFDNFLGQNPNGNWTLSVSDDTATNVGSLVRWDLTVSASAPLSPSPLASFSGTSGAIPEFGAGPTTAFTANVSGMGSYLWDVDLLTTIAHGACADLDITLSAPSGKTITVTTDNGFTGGVFNGTLFDDDANDPVTDHFYTLNVVATPLSPEGRLSAFRGENPNGVWTLRITDDSTAVAGSLTNWSLTLATVPIAPVTSATTFSSSPLVAIPDLGSVTDTIAVSGLSTSLSKLVLYTEIQHTWSDDIDIKLTSPAGTTVVVASDNAGNLDDVYNGTTWDPALAVAPSDYPYLDLVVATPLAPEGSFDNFVGENPNGTWTIEVFDDFGNDTGTLNRWDLTLSTCSGSGPLTFCTPTLPGTSSGCIPSIAAVNNPNVAHSNICVVTVSSVEGQKSGIVFYGVNGTQNQAWCSGGSSFLCVKPPTQRTFAQISGGAAGQCNGSLVLDWNAFQLANPSALGNPWSIGQQAHVQGWFRDPQSCKTTFLSAALELTYQP